MIDERDFNDWLQHPITKVVREVLQKKREELRQAWEGGSFTDYAVETTALVNVGNLGTCKGYAFVAELDFEQLTTELEDEPKQNGPQATGSSGAD